jgi:hypothetical protein
MANANANVPRAARDSGAGRSGARARGLSEGLNTRDGRVASRNASHMNVSPSRGASGLTLAFGRVLAGCMGGG